ncbi:MAG TPA: hypothetical protein VM536_14795 [Chloroflexia bacterium]|nr:hypothetical protein [Chloroflexia bacterium]
MLIENHREGLHLAGDDYRLVVARDRPVAELTLRERAIATLHLASGLDTLEAIDEETVLSEPVVERGGDAVVLTWTGHSTLWPHKTVELRTGDWGFSYSYRVQGQGAIDRAHFLRTRDVPSVPHAVRMFNPSPNSGAVRYTGDRCSPGKHCIMCIPDPRTGRLAYTGPPDFMTITVNREKDFHEGNWFFTPSPFCYAVEGAEGWMALGMAAAPGEWSFAEMAYPGDGFGFSLHYDGHTAVDGTWTSPRLLCLTAADEYQAVERYCAALRADGCVPDQGRGPAQVWWRRPMFCGWGEQVSQEVHWGRPAAAAWATQANYERWLATLAAHDIAPGTVVIDDKWQQTYGLNDVDPAKWPDLRGFITAQHAAGRRVLLWLKAWDPEGVPAAECICNGAGQPVAVDPGHPAYRGRLSEQVRAMLTDLDADGFKIDFTHLIPRGPLATPGGPQVLPAGPFGSRSAMGASVGGAWGLELMRQWLQIISDAARAAKPDALVITHTANPYLADLVDMLRLNDVAGLDDITAPIGPDMRHRARIARAASPYWQIDSDDWPCSSRGQWRDYLQIQASGAVGVPALYHAERLGWGRTDEPLSEEDFAAIRAAWSEYAAHLTEEHT